MNTRFAWAMARRELRSSRRRLMLYGSCMALGIAALVGLHGVRSTVTRAVDRQAQQLLGADLHLSSRAPLPEGVAQRVAELERSIGRSAAYVTQFGSMALAPRSGLTRLVDIRGVGSGFPFYGRIETEPAGLWERFRDESDAALVDASLLLQLDVAVGDRLAVGDSDFRIAGTIGRAPGTVGLRTQIAPRVFIARSAVAATGLIQTGSLVDYHVYLAGGRAELVPWIELNRDELEAQRVRFQTVRGYQADMGRSFATLTRYLALVGLVALALGGIGVAAGVRVFVREKLDTVAVLRSLGARASDVLAAYATLALALGAAAGLAGAAFGVGVQALLPRLLGEVLPVAVETRVEPLAVVTGMVLGLWVTGIFAIGPIFELARVPPLRALRRDFEARSRSRMVPLLMALLLGVSLLAVSVWQAPRAIVGASFAAGLASAVGLLALAARAVTAGLRRFKLSRAPYWLRQGIANLFRPRNHTLATTVAIGFGLFLVATLQSVHSNVRQQMAIDADPERPNLVIFDVQRDQFEPIQQLLAERGAPVKDQAPIVSARLAGLQGRESAEWLQAPKLDRDFRWALQREYRLSYHDTPRATETVVDGQWWSPGAPAAGELTPVSLDAGLAERLGLGVGDEMVWDIQGVHMRTVVGNLREIDWGGVAANFFVVFPSAALRDAPQSAFLIARHPAADARAALQRDIVARFPNVSIVDATVMLAAIDAMHREMGTAVQVLSLFTLATGFVILVAAAAAARSERRRESLLLRTLGAPLQTVRRIVTTEAIALGALAASVGSALSLLASWAVVRFAFELPFAPPLLDVAGLALATLALSAVLGAGGGGSARGSTPFAALREAEAAGAI